VENPAIKGGALKSLVLDARDGLQDGRISRVAANRALLPEDFQLLGEGIVDSEWYDVEVYRRLSMLVHEQLGGGDRSYFKKRGAAVAERLIGLGVYQQVEYLQRIEFAETLAVAHQNINLTATLWRSLFNFGGWTVSYGADRGTLSMLVADSMPMPALGWDAIEGFIQRLAQEYDAQNVTLIHKRRGDGTELFEFRFHGLSNPPKP
jgi:hypothetical protein